MGGFDINMPHIKMPKFGFGGKGKRSTSGADIDVDGNVTVPSVDTGADAPTTEIDANVEVPSAEVQEKGKGGTDFSLPKFGFGGHKGSKKKKKDKKKKDKNHSDSDSDSGDEDKHKKADLEFGSDIGFEKDLNFNAPRMDTNNDIDLKAGEFSGAIDTPNVDLKTPDSNIDIDADVRVKGQKGGFDINMPHIKMPKFGFGGTGKQSTSDADIDIDIDGNVNAPSVDDIITPTTEIDVNAGVHSAEIHGKGDGRADFNLPKFGFGGHKGSKKKKKSKKKK